MLRSDANAATRLAGDGDFRSDECIALLREADIVVTNPPFSLFREYVAQLIEHGKQFLILGNLNAITYKEFFPLIRDSKIWLGCRQGRDMLFNVPDKFAAELLSGGKEGSSYRVVDGVVLGCAPAVWFTNLDHSRRHEELILYKKYSPEKYPTYDNYDAINVNRVADIPEDWDGAMGVPITFLDKHNPDQFEILDANGIRVDETVRAKPHGLIKDKESAIDGQPKYVRIAVRRKG